MGKVTYTKSTLVAGIIGGIVLTALFLIVGANGNYVGINNGGSSGISYILAYPSWLYQVGYSGSVPTLGSSSPSYGGAPVSFVVNIVFSALGTFVLGFITGALAEIVPKYLKL